LLVIGFHTLRGASVLGIVGEILEAGWIGVDLFFVLSGFLITRILLDARGQPNFFKNFYARRALRIWPLYYAVLLFAIVAGPYFTGTLRYERSDYAWQWHVLFVQNLTMPRGVLPWPLGVTWSLAIEEQFYIVWPLLVLWLRTDALRKLLVATIAATFALRLGLLLQGTAPAIVYITTVCRIDALAAGALIAVWIQSAGMLPELVERWGRRAAIFLLPVAVTIAVLLLKSGILLARYKAISTLDAFVLASSFSMIACGFAGLLVLAVSSRPAFINSVLAFRPLRFAGEISYGLYLLHSILFTLDVAYLRPVILRLFDGSGLVSRIANLSVFYAVLLAVTYASWRWFERPFLKLKRHFA